jgi:anaerobic glycerol-3-phosphate dehydrogenase
MPTIPTEVLIIGGGIIGCAIAYYLRQSNVDVTILDQGEIGAQASSAAAGLLAPLGSLSGPGPLADLHNRPIRVVGDGYDQSVNPYGLLGPAFTTASALATFPAFASFTTTPFTFARASTPASC